MNRVQHGATRLASLLIGAVLLQTALGQKPSRDEVQAAYLYNFGKFVRWPESAGRGPLVVCVAGEDPSEPTIRRLVGGEQIDGRRIEERALDRPQDESDCSMLFIGVAEQDREDGFLAASEGKPILTVGDAPDFLARGGMIQFVLVGDHVRFSVNLDACTRHGVALSSELLKVAVAVTGKPAAGGAK